MYEMSTRRYVRKIGGYLKRSHGFGFFRLRGTCCGRMLAFCLYLAIAALVCRDAVASSSVVTTIREQGLASFYGDGTPTGKKTASGRGFNRDEFTAAHLTLPFGTVVRVFNLRNNRSALLMITDRGPYVKKRIIDVSSRGADVLRMRRSGVVPVVIEVVAGRSGRPLNSANSFYLLMGRADNAQKAHSLSASLHAALDVEIRGLITATRTGRGEYSLCVGPFTSFREAEMAATEIEKKKRVLEIIEAPTDGGDVPLHVPPVVVSDHSHAPVKKKKGGR